MDIKLKHLAKFVSEDILFNVAYFEGGYVPVKLTEEEVVNFMEGKIKKIEDGLNAKILAGIKASIREITNMYDDFNKLKNNHLPEHYIRFYFPDRGSDFPLNIHEHITLCFEQRELHKAITKKEFIKMLGGQEFIDKAQKLDYFLRKFLNEKSENETKMKKKNTTAGVVYLLKIKDKKQYKIGVTTNLNKRLDQISPKMPFEIKVEHQIEHGDIYGLEEKLHDKFKDKRIKGEWFKLDDDDVSYIKNM